MIYDDDRGDYKLCVFVHIVCSMLVLINWFSLIVTVSVTICNIPSKLNWALRI